MNAKSPGKKKRRFLLFLASLFLFLLAVSTYPVEAHLERVIRVGYYENAPKIYTDENGNVAGFWADLVRYIAVQQRWEIEWVHGTWDECLAQLENNEIDIMPDMGWSVARSEKYALSEETVLISWSRVYVPQGSKLETVLDLEGKTIAGLNGSVNFDGPNGIKELARKFGVHAEFLGLDSYDDVLQALEDHKADAGVTNKDFGNLHEEDYHVARTPIIFHPSKIIFGFNKDSELTPALIEGIDRWMVELKGSNFSIYYQLLDKWLGVHQKPELFFPSWLLWGFGITLALFALFLGFSVLLRRQVAEQTVTLRRYANGLETLNQVTVGLSSSLDLREVLTLIIQQVGKLLPMDSGAVFFRSEDGVQVMIDDGISPSIRGRVFPLNSKLLKRIEKSRAPVVVDTVNKDRLFGEWAKSQKIESWIGIPLIVRDHLIGFLTLVSSEPNSYLSEEIKLAVPLAAQVAQAIENARHYDRAQRRTEELAALRKIDRAIIGNIDLNAILDVLLTQTLDQLKVTAARVLLSESEEHPLSLGGAKGFQFAEGEETILAYGKEFVKKVAKTHEPLSIPDLSQADMEKATLSALKKEGFKAYHAVPLITKKTLVGVLDVFLQTSHYPTMEWIGFQHALAGQAVIAIDNYNLFADLQRSNKNLKSAYEATIEGWARALELRDMETEGHSRRVVDVTVNLARVLGYRDEELLNIRYGALLHDIGKMGVPDAILQKPGKLTEEEWVIMRRHPGYAYEWLSGIEYLRSALDIPYCHHEKWDGTGYPRGIRGKDIPKAARLFAVVDTWDALRVDRPYRKAWSNEKTLAYIQQRSGTSFDPEIVNAFMRFIEGEDREIKTIPL